MAQSETPLPTYEEACRCPRCGRPGEVRQKLNPPRDANLKPGSKIHYVYCVTELCRWYDTFWIIQVNPNGTIPAPKNHTGEKKIYQGFEGHDEMAAQILAAVNRDKQRQLEPGAELRGNRIV